MVGGEKMNKNYTHDITNNMSDLGSETIIASGFQEDVAGQGKTDSAAKHQSFLLKIT